MERPRRRTLLPQLDEVPVMREPRFKKVLTKWDTLALAFGATIGWGWVVMSGVWIETAGSLGAVLAFAAGGVMILLVGLTYAELTSALPECGGEHVFSKRALGYNWSFVCTWSLILGYLGVTAFEACALPGVFSYLVPNFFQGYLYAVDGYDVYLTYLLVGSGSAAVITLVNYVGVKPSAVLQAAMALMVALVGVLLLVSSGFSGQLENARPLFADGVGGFLAVAVMTPFSLMGFDVVPQAAEELNIPPRKIGKIILLSVVLGVVFYAMVILAVSVMLSHGEIQASELVTADALNKALGGARIGSVLLVAGGAAGIISSWNAFVLGGSRCIFVMADAGMLPAFFARIHPKHKTPANAVLLVGALSAAAPFLGKPLLTWVSNAGSFAIVIAYFIVALSFLVLRKKEPGLHRPFRVKRAGLAGGAALMMTFVMLVLYLPGLPSGMCGQEWWIVGLWALLGAALYWAGRRAARQPRERSD